MFEKLVGGLKMKHFKIIVVGGLCASLLSNYILFTKLDVMDNKINNISSYQHQVISTVNSQVGNINNTINKIKEDQSWLSAINVDTVIDASDKNKAMVNFEWQVKELKNNSEVLFNYKKNEEKEYKSIKAEDKGNGFFIVVIPVEIKPEPNWNYQVIDRSNNSSEKQMRVIEEKKEAYEREHRLSFDYYISVSHADMIKSGEINIARIEDIGARYYGYLEVRTEIDRDKNYNLSVMSGKMYDTSIYLQEAYLKKYNDDDQLVDEEKLVEENVENEGGIPVREHTAVFQNKSSEEKMDYSSLVLKVVYSDGSVFEREIYSK